MPLHPVRTQHFTTTLSCVCQPKTGLETNGSQLVRRLVEIPFWLVSRALSLAILANENFRALKHRMETKLNIASDDWIPKAN